MADSLNWRTGNKSNVPSGQNGSDSSTWRSWNKDTMLQGSSPEEKKISLDWRSRKNEDMLLGTVKALHQNFGFIVPDDPLPPGYEISDVYFAIKYPRDIELTVGEKVRFLLNNQSKEKPQAFRVLKCNGTGRNVASKINNGLVDPSIPAYSSQNGAVKLTQRNEGKVIKVLESGTGCIRITGDVPDQYKEFRDTLYFDSKWVECGGIKIRVGDKVEFDVSLNKRHENQFSAHRIKLVECRPKNNAEIYQVITEMINKITDEAVDNSGAILQMLRCDAIWKSIGSCLSLLPETMSRLLDLLEMLSNQSKASAHIFKHTLEVLLNTQFYMHKSSRSCFRQFVKGAWENDEMSFQNQIKKFLLMVLDYLPTKARMVATLAKSMLSLEQDSTEHFLYMVLNKVSNGNTDDIEGFEWDELPLVPSTKELLQGSTLSSEYMNQVKTHGPYESVQDYMDTYFRLLREDCFSSLRTGVQKYLNNTLDPRDMNMYTGISLCRICLTTYGGGVTLGIKIVPCNLIDDWRTCRNLQFGNLLCLSPSGSFTDPIWATVCEKDPELLETDGIIWVKLVSDSNYLDDTECISALKEARGRTVMAESPTYYIAYQPVLKTLQDTNAETLAFQAELVNMKPPCPPETFDEQSVEPSTELDESQTVAFKQALFNRLSIIQGPPGTGKTFIGIHLIRHFLKQEVEVKFPILVLTYKNHALDEFTKTVMQFLPNGVARVGGRSEDPELVVCNLKTLKSNHSMPKQLASERHTIQNEVFAVKGMVRSLMEKFEAATDFSAETVLRTFNFPQIEKLLWGFKAKHGGTTAETKGIKDALIKYEDSLNDTEKSTEELMSNLDKELVAVIDQALKEWLPPLKTFEDIMKVEEGPTHLRTLQNEPELEVDSEHPPSDIDETDVAEEEEERRAAFLYPWEYDKSQDEITVKDRNVRVPYIGSIAKRWATVVTLPSLTQIDDLWSLSDQDKVFIIQAILWHQKDTIERGLKDAMEKYKQLLLIREEIEQQRKVSALQGKQVIAMTITGASIHHRLLQSLKPAIIIVEEAAEVLEPQLMAVLGSWVRHMILIGDHKQLRPSVDSYILARDYHLDLSMMERLVNNNYPYATLQMQSRMLPEMAELLTDIYPDLQSNEDQVKDNHPPDFLPAMYFWTHEDQETEDRSFSNEKEAARVVKLALFFLLQGYKIEDITILAAYRGQVKLLRQMLREAESDHPSIFPPWFGSNNATPSATDGKTNIKVHTIDMYQGDENKIVIVSLVRSNKDGQIGFLKTINRRCVAQSRARCGMYFIGNATTFLMAKASCWKSVIEKMHVKNLVGKKLPLHCRYHSQASKVEAETADFIPLTGICKVPCELKMDCGKHECVQNCQPFHKHKCHEIVKFVHEDCKHPGLRECWETESEVVCTAPCEKMMLCGVHLCASPCQPEHSHLKDLCEAPVEHTFSDCGHMTIKKCGELEGTLRCSKSCLRMMGCGIHWCYSNCKPSHSHLASACREQVSYKFPECGHKTKKKCGQDESKLLCSTPCKKLMDCGLHQCPSKCQPEHSHKKALCPAPVLHTLKLCGHMITKQCREEESVLRCDEPCTKLMNCGEHKCPSKCQPEHLHFSRDCTVPTQHKLQSCGHIIEKMCGEDALGLKCKKRIFAKLKKCPHYITIECWQSNDWFRCNAPCTRKLACNHPCEGLCGNTCDASCRICEQLEEIDRKNKLEVEEKEREKAREKAQQELADLVVNNPYLLTRCHLQLLLPEGDTASEYIDVCDRVQKYVQPKHNWCPEVSRIEKITNLKLYERWLQAKSDMFDPTRAELKFHGADEEGVENIIGHGFQLPETEGMYGLGVYFATDSSKSAQSRYTKNSNKLLLCNVLLGRSLTVDSAKPSMKRETLREMGYDSLYAKRKTEENGGVLFDEYVIYDPAQALPKYIIHYGQSTLENMSLNMSVPKAFKEQNLTPKRQYDPNDPMDFHFRLAESQFLRLTKFHHITAEVKSVDFYQTPLLIKRFNEKEKQLKAKYPGGDECKPILAFHGTSAVNIPSIVRSNFDMSRNVRGAYGGGMYFSEFPDVSIGYAQGANKLILCQLLPGRAYQCPGPMHNAPLQPGYDSHIVSADTQGRGQMVVIFDSDQILPTYVINY